MSNQSEFVEVHDPEYTKIYSVPSRCISHVPPRHLDISRLVLCRNFDPEHPTTSCTKGGECKFVHADFRNVNVSAHDIHVHYCVSSPSDSTYKRLPEGEILHVFSPNGRLPVEAVPSECVIVTKGSLSRHRGSEPLSHCAHFYINRMCNRGEKCSFIHAVHIQPTAKNFQRAPPHTGAGLTQSKASLAITAAAQAGLPIPRLVAVADAKGDVSTGSESPDSTPMDLSSGETSISLRDSPIARPLDVTTTSCATSGQEPALRNNGKRYRRHPYSTDNVLVSLV